MEQTESLYKIDLIDMYQGSTLSGLLYYII